MKLYDWMVKPTLQREWIERRGLLLWLAFFFIELGAGTFFIASFFHPSHNLLIAMLVGWLICAILGGGIHILYLGHPLRLWRMLLRPGTSWISRGLIFVSIFLILGLVYLAIAQFAGQSVIPLLVVADIFAFLAIIYGGFAMNYVKGITLWNTALLPILYVISGFWGGAGIALAIALVKGSTALGISVEEWVRILLISYIVLLTVYLISVRYSGVIGTFSVREMIAGKWWPLMWFGVIVVGLLLPMGVVGASYFLGLKSMLPAVLYLSIFCELLGDLALRYLILRCGFYSPLVPAPT
jgi:sulfite dehydrogenase (quinone) subunit SoeC